LLEDVEGVFALWIRRIIDSISFYPIAGVDNYEIRAVGIGFVLEMLGEGDVIAPICRILWPR
jgi:hypothetical protein